MQCAACLEVYPDVLDVCPQCPAPETDATPQAADDSHAMPENSNISTPTTSPPASSTLIEFPGVNRNRPAWRKELSERFREIQQRRAQEAEAELRFSLDAPAAAPGRTAKNSEATKQLGLVPPPDEPELNPIVVKALRRVERARRQAEPTRVAGGAGRGHAATAAARVVEERPEPEAARNLTPAPRPAEPQAAPKPAAAEKQEKAQAEPARATGLLVVQQKLAAEAKAAPIVEPATTAPRPETEAKAAIIPPPAPALAAPEESVTQTTEAKPQPRKISGVIDDHWLERRGADLLPRVEEPEVTYDDRAPRLKRLSAGLLDMLVVAFLSAPCAAVIELTIGDWSEPRVMASMGGIVLVLMFLYHTCSVALASRTLGMKLLGLHTVDAGTARVPTTWQCARRAFVYIVSLASFGLGLLYSLFDAEGRTVHDLLSNTVVVKE